MHCGKLDLKPRVNGSLLMKHTGQNVAIIGNVLKTHPNGKAFDIQTSDNHVVTVLLETPLNDIISGLVEVHGKGQGQKQIQCSYYMSFPPELADSYDAEIDNDVITVVHAIPNPWR
uniref:Replication factor A protein 3 n=1 Tax=Clastoptera arizonana TaxID=38151 RepID=A0A1B6DMY0_9HEMI